jgi:hypothetical protein
MLVVRDFLYALVKCYPSIGQRAARRNLKEAFLGHGQDLLFDRRRGRGLTTPAGRHGARWARYYITVISRLNDVTQSVNR